MGFKVLLPNQKQKVEERLANNHKGISGNHKNNKEMEDKLE